MMKGRSADDRGDTATVVDISNDDDVGITLATGQEMSTISWLISRAINR